MARDAGLLPVVAEIYEASVDADGLDKLAGVVAGALGTRSGFLALLARPEEGQLDLPAIVGLPSATENFDDWARSAYADHYHDCNIWFERGVKRGFPAIVLSQELVPGDQLVRSEWYEYCQRLDTFHVLGAQFHLDRRLSVQFGAQRPRRADAFDEASRRKMSLLVPHLQRALQIMIRLGLSDQVRTVSFDLLERLGLGVLILDGGRRLLFANRAAEQVLEQGTALSVRDGRVSASAAAARGFERLVEEATRTSAGDGMSAGGNLDVDADEEKLRLFVAPVPRYHVALGLSVPAVLVLLGDPSGAPATHADELRKAFGLTRAEAQLLAALMLGERLADYSARRGISLGTVRTHLKRLLGKTGHHRQVDLVRAVARDPLLRVLHESAAADRWR
jgi:DNA-binding CsgD family transcriptional regulator